MSTRCRPGDLAVVIQAQNPTNLGRIVRVIAPHDGTGDIVYSRSAGAVWLVECARPLTWTFRGKRYRRKSGPAPDHQLQPIRGDALEAHELSAVRALVERIKTLPPKDKIRPEVTLARKLIAQTARSATAEAMVGEGRTSARTGPQ